MLLCTSGVKFQRANRKSTAHPVASIEPDYPQQAANYVPVMTDSDTSYGPYAPLDPSRLPKTRKPRNAYRISLAVPPSLLRPTEFLDNLCSSSLSSVLQCVCNLLPLVAVAWLQSGIRKSPPKVCSDADGTRGLTRLPARGRQRTQHNGRFRNGNTSLPSKPPRCLFRS